MTRSFSSKEKTLTRMLSTTISPSILRATACSAVGDEELIKIHFHTNEPWKVLEYCATLGEIYDIVVEDMIRQERGLKG